MIYNKKLVEEQSARVFVIKDDVEYDWYVGCTPTAVAMVVGFYDRNGFDNLMDGDTSSYNKNVRDQIGSNEHIENYFIEDENDHDASSRNEGHEDNSIADSLLSSRSSFGLVDGHTAGAMSGAGFHNYATTKGYDNFETSVTSFSDTSFVSIMVEINAGRPVILDVDAFGGGIVNHSITVFGYDLNKKQLLVHDGWGAEGTLRPIDFAGVQEGQNFGISNATFIKPPKEETDFGDMQFTQIVDDGEGSAASHNGEIFDKRERSEVKEDSSFHRSKLLGSASEDGAKYFSLYNNGDGTTSMLTSLASGDGGYRHLVLSRDSGLSDKTIDLATADGKTFYSLVDDGKGTAALYEVKQNQKGSFDKKLLNSDSGLSLKTDGFATVDGKLFQSTIDDGDGKPVLLESSLHSNGKFFTKIVDRDSHLGDDGLALATWVTEKYIAEPVQVPAPEPTPKPAPAPIENGKVYSDIKGKAQYLDGKTDNDVFAIAGKSKDYDWDTAQDGKGVVVWNKQTGQHDVLYDFEKMKFNDKTVDLTKKTYGPDTNVANGTAIDNKGTTQYLTGDKGKDVFKIDGDAKDYGWEKTADNGHVVWNKKTEDHDILYDFEELKFNDTDIALG